MVNIVEFLAYLIPGGGDFSLGRVVLELNEDQRLTRLGRRFDDVEPGCVL
jgi:hypothetical protein